MSRNLFILFGNLIFLLSINCFAEPVSPVCQENTNKIVCESGTIEQVNYLSDVVFNGTNVTGITKIIGDVSANRANFNILNITGDFNGINSEVIGDVKMLGDLHFYNLIFRRNVNITGDVKCNHTQFFGPVKLVGNLNCEEGNFNDDLFISSTVTTLNKSIVKNIQFTPSPKQQVLHLRGSTVSGSIIFSSNNGVIYSSEGSDIKGNVVGGKIIYQ